jgi:Glycosyltransferase family 92
LLERLDQRQSGRFQGGCSEKRTLYRFAGHNHEEEVQGSINVNSYDYFFNLISGKVNYYCILRCQIPTVAGTYIPLSEWSVYVQGSEDSTLHGPVTAEVIDVLPKQEQGVRVCLGALYSNKVPQLADFITDWTYLDVRQFYLYAPLYTSREWEEAGNNDTYDAPALFPHHLVSWQVYKPIRGVFRHSKILAYNDCFFRHMREAEFLAFVDADEFLHFPKGPPSSFLQWLREKTTHGYGGICTSVRTPSGDCLACLSLHSWSSECVCMSLSLSGQSCECGCLCVLVCGTFKEQDA